MTMQTPAAPNVLLATTETVPGYRVVRVFGLVRGIAMREMPFLLSDAGVLGALTVLDPASRRRDLGRAWEACESTRAQAAATLAQHAASIGANAVIGLRYDTVIVHASLAIWEIVAYGTAVVVAQ